MLELLKNYYVFVLLLLVFSYLVPKEEYKKYLQFFIGIFIVVLFLKPVISILENDNPTRIYEVFETFNRQMEQLELEEMEGENLYEHFFLEGER